jgi:hypothetical protein
VLGVVLATVVGLMTKRLLEPRLDARKTVKQGIRSIVVSAGAVVSSDKERLLRARDAVNREPELTHHFGDRLEGALNGLRFEDYSLAYVGRTRRLVGDTVAAARQVMLSLLPPEDKAYRIFFIMHQLDTYLSVRAQWRPLRRRRARGRIENSLGAIEVDLQRPYGDRRA